MFVVMLLLLRTATPQREPFLQHRKPSQDSRPLLPLERIGGYCAGFV